MLPPRRRYQEIQFPPVVLLTEVVDIEALARGLYLAQERFEPETRSIWEDWESLDELDRKYYRETIHRLLKA